MSLYLRMDLRKFTSVILNMNIICIAQWRYMCSNLWSHVQNTNTFSCALLWPVVYSSQFYSLMSRYFGALSIFTGKADTKDFTVLVFTGNAHSQWIWSENFWSCDSAPPMAFGENTDYIINIYLYLLENHFKVFIILSYHSFVYFKLIVLLSYISFCFSWSQT